MNSIDDEMPDLTRRATKATVSFLLALALMIFVPAWSLTYWQGWAFLSHFAAWSIATTAYSLRHDRQLVESRMRVGPAAETSGAQKRIQAYNSIVIVLLLIGSALDHHFRPSAMPPWVVFFGHLLFAAGFLGCVFVLRQNSFASATVRIQPGQHVVSTGPYGLVRHPMYAAALLLFIGMPLALGSWRGLLFVPLIAAGLVARLLDEERHLVSDLPGYEAYRHQVRYRLVPGIW